MFTVQSQEQTQTFIDEASYHHKDKMQSLRRTATTTEASFAMGKRAPWMKHMSLSMRDLISDTVDPDEEDHMKIACSLQDKEFESLPTLRRPVSLPAPRSRFHDVALQRTPRDMGSSNADTNMQREGECLRRRQDIVLDSKDDMEVDTVRKSLLSQATIEKEESTLMHSDLECSESFVAQQEAILSQIQRKRSKSPLVSIRNSNRQPINQVEATKGSKIKIHDQDRVYDAINNGTATVLKCIGCSKHMLTTKDVELIFCPGCGTLSPLKLAEIPTGKRPALPVA